MVKATVFWRSSRRRNPLVRMALAVVAIGLLALASVFVLALAGGVLAVWLLRRGWQRLHGMPHPAPAAGAVLDAEYRVVARETSRLASR